jgi:ribonuclease HI
MDAEEGIIYDRRLILCPATEDWSVPELLQECPECNDFLLYCCACNNKLLDLPRSRRPANPCHHFHIIFTDGACINNGRPEAKAGVGVAYGKNDGSQLSMPITDSADNFALRTNQRAELYAAKLGLEFLAEADRINTTEPSDKLKGESKAWIIATDSEYVVKGMTEWLPTWRVYPTILAKAFRDSSNRAYRGTTGARPKVLNRQIWICFSLSIAK